MSGYSQEEIVGRNCRFLQGADREQEALATIRAALANQEACVVTLRNYRKNGELFLNRLSIRPLVDREGNVIYDLGVQYDVTDQVTLRHLAGFRPERRRGLASRGEAIGRSSGSFGRPGDPRASTARSPLGREQGWRGASVGSRPSGQNANRLWAAAQARPGRRPVHSTSRRAARSAANRPKTAACSSPSRNRWGMRDRPTCAPTRAPVKMARA
jgi:PAS domain S-box-containing protein